MSLLDRPESLIPVLENSTVQPSKEECGTRRNLFAVSTQVEAGTGFFQYVLWRLPDDFMLVVPSANDSRDRSESTVFKRTVLNINGVKGRRPDESVRAQFNVVRAAGENTPGIRHIAGLAIHDISLDEYSDISAPFGPATIPFVEINLTEARVEERSIKFSDLLAASIQGIEGLPVKLEASPSRG